MNGIELIKHFESCKLEAYQDSVGVWTIGYGHTLLAKKGMKITQNVADELLEKDLHTKHNELSQSLSGLMLSQNQYDAILSFVFNLGIGNFRKSTLYSKMLDDPNDILIGVEFLKWHKAGGRRYRGLLLRRIEECKLYFTK